MRFLAIICDQLFVLKQTSVAHYRPLMSARRQARKDFIVAKYTEKRFARKKCPDATSRLHTLCDAVKARDIFSLVQVFAEGVDLMEPIPLANGHVSHSLAPLLEKTSGLHRRLL